MEIEQLKASVVINTYNRADYLPNAMLSIASQSYPHVELIVVNGPSTDSTQQVLDEMQAHGISFKRASCPSRNLSESRNIGIGAASGDVVFFIDDDAVAHRDWVRRIMHRYADEKVGGVGGFTFDHTGVAFQCRYTVCDRLGNARFFDTVSPESLLTHPDEFYYPSLLGTNCSFRMSRLKDIGGFDEVFAYMLDETDVCLRIHERGDRIVTVPDAYVFHKYAPSHSRTPERIPNALLAPARSKVYFCLKHASQAGSVPLATFAEVDRYKKDIEFANRWYLDHKKITPAHFSKLSRELSEGVGDGLRLGMDPAVRNARSTHLSRPDLPSMEFRAMGGMANAGANRCLKIYFVSQGYPPTDTSGIARWTFECARSLTELGHEVHVITRSTSNASHLDYFEGVWVHSVIDLFEDENAFLSPVPIPGSIARRAGAVLREVRRCIPIFGVDIVSAPIWDVEGIYCAAYLDVPVITSLHTTYKLALPFKPDWILNRDYRANHVNKVINAETWLLKNSRQILANSGEVVREINGAYEDVLSAKGDAVTTIAHGLGRPLAAQHRAGAEWKNGKSPRILFVGRIEERKGPDQLFAALQKITPCLNGAEVRLVGKSPGEGDPYVKKVHALAAELKRKCPSLKVNFVGYVADAELEGEYAAADIFVAPSRFESFGLILIEAMRHGVPVIACDIGGMREVVSSGVDGMLFKVEDSGELGTGIKALIDSSDTRVRIGAAARATYQDKFTGAVMGQALEDYLTKIVDGARDE